MVRITKQRLSVFLVTACLAGGVHAAENTTDSGGVDPIPGLDCVIEPSEVVDVGSAVPGVVETIHAFRSDLVEKGAVIVELESSVEQAAVELARARSELTTAIELRQENAKLGHLTQKRNQKLLQTSAISLQEMDKLKTETRMAELQVRQEKENKRIAGLEYHRARAVLQRRAIRSPVNGVVVDRFKSVGEYVEDEPVLRVAQLDPLHVEVIVPVDYLGRVTPGMRAEVKPIVAGSMTHQAKVERVDRVSDAASGTYGVRLSLPNPDYEIPAGLRCRLSFLPSGESDSAALVDKSSLPPTTVEGGEADAAQDLDPEPVGKPETPRSGPISQTAMAAPVARPTFCYTVGPVVDEKQAKELFDRLERQSADLVMRNETVNVEHRYLILAAPQPGRQATRRLVARLNEAGITDRHILARGSYKGRVSLGVYRASKSAASRRQRLAEKGFEADIIPLRKETTRYWLDGSLGEESDPAGRVEEIIRSLSPSPSFHRIDCPKRLAHR